MAPSVISVEYKGRLAIITIDNAKKLNALDGKGYFDLSRAMREVTTHDEVFITLLIGKGRFFSAGADVGIANNTPGSSSSSSSPGGGDPTSADDDEVYRYWRANFLPSNLDITQAFYTHPKILVVGLNGPVVGLSAALAAFGDFIYAAPSTFLLTPFSSLGLVAEGGSSRALIRRLGVSKANEALIMSRRIPASDLVSTGFVNAILDAGDDKTGQKFRELVLAEIDDKLGEHLVGDSLVGIKKLIMRPEIEILERQNVDEVFAGLQRFVSGVPQGEFIKLATGQKRHKL